MTAPGVALVVDPQLSYSGKGFEKAKVTCLDWRILTSLGGLEAQHDWG